MAPRDLKIPSQRHPEKQRRADAPQPKKPDWIRVKAPTSEGYKQTRDIMRENKLVTVCEEAGCPNVGECWSQGHATMMIMGEVCTRACTFCNIATGKPPEDLDVFEPGRVADAVKKLGLKHVVITSVDRDDIEDGGAEHFAQTIRAVRRQSPGTTIEILTPDFIRCDDSVLKVVVDANQIRHHGRPWRRPTSRRASHGRHARRRHRFLDHRPIPATHTKTPRSRPFRDPRRIRSLRKSGLRQGFLDGFRNTADPVKLPRRRRFRTVACGASQKAWRGVNLGAQPVGRQPLRPPHKRLNPI